MATKNTNTINGQMALRTLPEEYMQVPHEEPVNLDALHCTLARAHAVLNILQDQFNMEPGERYGDKTISNVLWALEGYLEQLESLTHNKPLQRVV